MSKSNDKAVRDQLAADRARQAEIVAEQEKAQSAKPTPTQEEVDLAKLGVEVELEPSGEPEGEQKAESADKPGSYKTRNSTAG